MRAEHDITIDVDGEEIPVHLEEPGMFDKIELGRILSTGPNADTMELMRDPNIKQYIKETIKMVSDFPPELLNELPDDAFNELTRACAEVVQGNDPTVQEQTFEHESESTNPFGDLDLNSDGTVDFDDCR